MAHTASMNTGVFRWGQLCALAPRSEIDKAIRDGRLLKLRHGWYATPDADPETARAVSAGGVLSCASALAKFGVWTPPTDRTHLRGNDAVARLHPTWCRRAGRQPAEAGAVDDLTTSLQHAAKCLPSEDFVVVCDSVLNKRLVSPIELATLFTAASRRLHETLDRCDGRAESGTESMVRLRIARPNLRIRPQVNIVGVGRVDLLVGESLIIEVDGYAYHADPDTFENDRLRDLRAHALGYNVVRLTFQQVVYQWRLIEPLLMELIRRRVHLRPLPRITNA